MHEGFIVHLIIFIFETHVNYELKNILKWEKEIKKPEEEK